MVLQRVIRLFLNMRLWLWWRLWSYLRPLLCVGVDEDRIKVITLRSLIAVAPRLFILANFPTSKSLLETPR